MKNTAAPTKKEMFEALVDAEIERRVQENADTALSKKAALKELQAQIITYTINNLSSVTNHITVGDSSVWRCEAVINYIPNPAVGKVDGVTMPPAIQSAWEKWNSIPDRPHGWDVGRGRVKRKAIADDIKAKLAQVNAVAVANAVDTPEVPLENMPVINDYLMKFLSNLNATTKAAARLSQ